MAEFANLPEEQFPDSAYRKRLGYKSYPEALVYEGEATQARLEFKVPTLLPIPWVVVRESIEGQVWAQNRKLLRLGLWQGPEIKGFADAKMRFYKVEVTEHGSPALITIIAVIVVALSVFGTVLVVATKAGPVPFKEVAKGFARIPGAIKWIAAASIAATLFGAVKTLKTS